MRFNESNTVEAFLRDRLKDIGWEPIEHATISRQPQEVLVEAHLREALVRLNPTVAERPERADEVLYRLRAAIMTVRDTGLVKANEEFSAWLLGERSMPFGANGEHVTIRLIDFDTLKNNRFVVTQQFTFRAGKTEKRADIVLLVNGMPLVIIEAKTPVRSSESWLDGALQINEDYEKNVPELFVPNVFSMATEGKEYRYGSVRMPVELWGPWRLEDDDALPSMEQVEKAVTSMLRPSVVLDMLSSFTAYATHKGKQRIKIIARYQQVDGVNKIVDPKDPLKILIVTSKLLTGFDAPILQTMYLDKPLRDHTLLQAICRVNRPYSEEKTHGLIVDYLGIFDDVAQALQFDEKGVRKAVSNIAELVGKLPAAMQKCLAYFAGCDRTLQGYEGLIAAQECLPNNTARDAFAADFSVLAKIWEAVSPDPVLTQYEKDFRWLVQVYESLKPSTGTGRLLWHRLGAKTIELIHQNVHVDAVRDDLDTLVLDADLLQAVLGDPDPAKKGREISIKLTARLRKHAGNPKYKALAERLEDLKNRHEQGLLVSIDFLKALLDLAKDVVRLERETPATEEIDRGKAALTQLFEEAKNGSTPVMVKRVVDDIDEIVRAVRFDGWQNTHAGEREVKIALRKTLFKYKLHQDNSLFERAYGYIKEYY